MTISGFLIAGIFFLISSSKPLKTLSPERPPTKLFSGYILATIIAQFAVHFAIMYIIRKMTLPFVNRYILFVLSILVVQKITCLILTLSQTFWIQSYSCWTWLCSCSCLLWIMRWRRVGWLTCRAIPLCRVFGRTSHCTTHSLDLFCFSWFSHWRLFLLLISGCNLFPFLQRR